MKSHQKLGEGAIDLNKLNSTQKTKISPGRKPESSAVSPM